MPRRARGLPRLELDEAVLYLLRWHVLHMCRDVPNMAVGVGELPGAVAVELVLRLAADGGAGLRGARDEGVDVGHVDRAIGTANALLLEALASYAMGIPDLRRDR